MFALRNSVSSSNGRSNPYVSSPLRLVATLCMQVLSAGNCVVVWPMAIPYLITSVCSSKFCNAILWPAGHCGRRMVVSATSITCPRRANVRHGTLSSGWICMQAGLFDMVSATFFRQKQIVYDATGCLAIASDIAAAPCISIAATCAVTAAANGPSAVRSSPHSAVLASKTCTRACGSSPCACRRHRPPGRPDYRRCDTCLHRDALRCDRHAPPPAYEDDRCSQAKLNTAGA